MQTLGHDITPDTSAMTLALLWACVSERAAA
jgi:hypothetical protein